MSWRARVWSCWHARCCRMCGFGLTSKDFPTADVVRAPGSVPQAAKIRWPDDRNGVILTERLRSPPKEETMAQVLCQISDGLRKSEATVKLTTYDGRPEFL